jgi:hypothetical protein
MMRNNGGGGENPVGPTVAMAGVVEYIEQSCPCIQTRHDAMKAYRTEKRLPQQYMQPSGLIDAPLAKPAKKIPPVFTVSFVGPTAYVDSQEEMTETIPRSSSSQTSHYTD